MQAGNPYIVGNPIREPEIFFGRRDILDWVSSELTNIHTNALVLYGQRRVGKTTILLQLRHSLPSEKFLPIYFDLQDQAKKRLGEVLADLADSAGSVVNLNEHKPENFDNEGKYFRSVFLPDLYKALDEDCRPVFLLDEFDVLDQGDERSLDDTVASRALFPFLRQVMNDDVKPAFVFVVGRRTEDLRVDFNQMFKTSLEKDVWVLDRQSAEDLVRQAEKNNTLKFTQEAVDRILQITKGHAYLTQLVCQRIWQRVHLKKPVEIPGISVDDVESSISEALEVGEQALIWLWNGLSPAEKIYAAALAEISDEDKAISEDKVINVLEEHAARLRRREVELAPQDLITRHVLEKTQNREYIFAIELFRRWVKQKRSLKDVVDEIDNVNPLAKQLFDLGQAYHNRREWSDAARYFTDALKQEPSHFRANLLLGETFLSMGQTEDAVRQLEIAYLIDSFEAQYPLARALMALASEKEKSRLEQDALIAIERALAVSPNERLAQDAKKRILERQGDNALKQGDLQAALSAFEKAGNSKKVKQVESEYKLRELQTLEQEAEAFTQKMEWKQAILKYEQLVEKAPDEKSKTTWQSGLIKCKEEENLESLFTLGLGALTRGDLEQAKKALSEVVYIRPDYAKNGKPAVKLLEQAVAGRKPVTVETIFQSNIFRVFGTISLLIVVGYLSFNGFQGLGIGDLASTPTNTIIVSETATDIPQSAPIQTELPTVTSAPTSTPKADPTLYDDFKNTNFDGGYDTTLWSKAGDNTLSVFQEDGALQLLTTDATQGGEYVLLMRQPPIRSIDRMQFLEAQLRVDEQQNGFSFVKIQIIAENINGYTWDTECGLGFSDGLGFVCEVINFFPDGNANVEYRSTEVETKLNTWYTVRIEIDPTSATIYYYLDGEQVGTFTPKDASELISANNFVPRIGVWDGSTDSIFKYQITDVRITP